MKRFLLSGFFLSLSMSNAAVALDCTNPPSNGFGSGYSAYARWCTQCGGTPQNTSGVSCTPGQNWGGSQGGGGSGEDIRVQALHNILTEMMKPEDPAVTAEKKARQQELERIKRETREAEERARIKKENEKLERLKSEVKMDAPCENGDLELDSIKVGDESPAIARTIKALKCAVESIVTEWNGLEKKKAVSPACLNNDLAKIEQALRQPISLAPETKKIQSIHLNHMESNGKEMVAEILVSRDEATGKVFIVVQEESSKRAGFFSRIFGKKTANSESHNVLSLDASGNIIEKEVTGPTKKCLKGAR